MSKNKIMPWVDALPNVEATDFQARRDQIEATMAEAAELVKQAEELRGKAYFAALSLEPGGQCQGRMVEPSGRAGQAQRRLVREGGPASAGSSTERQEETVP